MLENSFGVQLSYASVDAADGADPRPAARELLVHLRVPAGLIDADAAWGESQQEAVVAIPITDAGFVLTLTDQDVIATTLTAGELRTAFADAGLTLWLQDSDDGCCDDGGCDDGGCDDSEADALVTESFDEASDISAEFDAAPVRISVFSHRGPSAARLIAQVNGLDVEYIESGSWSLLRFESEDPTNAGVAAKAELPVIELNRVDDGGDWFEVTTNGGVHQFWPDAERHTVPVMDLEALTVPETAEICRRLLSDGDGSRDELVQIAAHSRLDVAGAHRALQPEALDGVVGTRARQEAFLAAFGVPADLIAAVFDEAGSSDTDLEVLRFGPDGWGSTLGEILVDGMSGFTPLTRRDRPLARVAGALRRNRLLAAALSIGELALGVAASRRRGFSRFVGILLIVDAIADLAIGVVRARRGR
ncbi:hypothetical protein ACSS7Z_04920 [Microbacterium sp. A82]|uniref:hypothetical protein n=1 Tax=Microbacterium sp. A82 TaxID=3450452 RepID=UPI003F3E8784